MFVKTFKGKTIFFAHVRIFIAELYHYQFLPCHRQFPYKKQSLEFQPFSFNVFRQFGHRSNPEPLQHTCTHRLIHYSTPFIAHCEIKSTQNITYHKYEHVSINWFYHVQSNKLFMNKKFFTHWAKTYNNLLTIWQHWLSHLPQVCKRCGTISFYISALVYLSVFFLSHSNICLSSSPQSLNNWI